METQHALVSNDVRVRGSVIIVDDDEPTCHLLADCVRLLGFDVQIATSATQALAMMRAHPVNVAVCDIVMPGYDGVMHVHAQPVRQHRDQRLRLRRSDGGSAC